MSEERVLTHEPIAKHTPLALVFIKPGYTGNQEIEQWLDSKLEEKSMTTISSGELQLTQQRAMDFYSHQKGKLWFNTYLRFVTSAPINYRVVASNTLDDSVFYQDIREIASNLRQEFGRKKKGTKQRKGANPIHASESYDEALRELELLHLDVEL